MEKHLIILSIIIILFYYLYCNQKDNKETFTTTIVGCNDYITTLATLARNLQKTTGTGSSNTIDTNLNLKNRHILSSDEDGWLRLKSYSNLNQKADMAVRNLNVIGNFNLLPSGIIVAWNNSNVPVGWVLCDGVGLPLRPDLRGRFILGKPENPSTINIGGAEQITLNINHLPPHTHVYAVPTGGGIVGDEKPRVNVYTQSVENNTTSTGQGLPFNNMPPYYVLTYIMKL